MGGGFSKMKKQAKMMQDKMQQMQEELENKKVEGKAANDLVIITLNGNKELINIKINPECVDKNDVEGLQDLIGQAFKDAADKLNSDDTNSSLGNMLGF
ncbi:MAG: Nucleoid-associated protein [Candidatus Anoxychlamydiales bacterium]|nr:Nucleoid-associated protein [Candidatus Anoxychlamydiales bacterium]